MAANCDWQGMLDTAILGYLRREPATLHQIIAWAELHSEEDIYASIQRLKKAGKIAEVHGGRKGAVWGVLYEEAS